jgi:hypothetical protein
LGVSDIDEIRVGRINCHQNFTFVTAMKLSMEREVNGDDVVCVVFVFSFFVCLSIPLPLIFVSVDRFWVEDFVEHSMEKHNLNWVLRNKRGRMHNVSGENGGGGQGSGCRQEEVGYCCGAIFFKFFFFNFKKINYL